MKLLITGGAGYIGSHMARMLADKRHDVVALDTLERGFKASLPDTIRLYEGNVSDKQLLTKIFSTHHIEGVLHFAGYIQVGESVQKPRMYIDNNVLAPLTLLDVMRDFSATYLIFSSTAAVYGSPDESPILETHPKRPENPYGISKWWFEEYLRYYDSLGIRSISLRYFNAAGASLDGGFGEAHVPESHIIPLAIATALGKQDSFRLFGTDYDTPDGTCLRDYIHVEDLCAAHIKALEALVSGHATDAYNVGTGEGSSNRQVIETVKSVTGAEFEIIEEKRRPGDANSLVANSNRLKSELGWSPKHSDLKTIIESAWAWHKEHPEGYK